MDEITPWYVSYSVSILNLIFIFTLDAIYAKVNVKLVDGENHRYESSYENSMLNKRYMFNFVLFYLWNFVSIVYS